MATIPQDLEVVALGVVLFYGVMVMAMGDLWPVGNNSWVDLSWPF